MRNCLICNKVLNRGDKMIVLSFPVTCRHEGGDYSFLDDFSKNERIIHLNCCPDIRKIFNGNITEKDIFSEQKPDLVRLLYRSLLDLQEKTNLQQVMLFCSKNRQLTDISDLLEVWFKNRDKIS